METQSIDKPAIDKPAIDKPGAAMARFARRSAAFAVCVAVSACVSPAQRVQNKEDMLAASGFTLVPANTPERQTSLASLPPHELALQVSGDQVTYTYADPTVCGCLYVGDQAAYGRYRETAFLKHLAREREMRADMYRMFIDWGADRY
jgi:hypothetical protein